MTIQGHPGAHKAPGAPVVKIVVPGDLVVPPAAAVAAAVVVKTTIGLKRPMLGSSSRRPAAQHSLQGQGSLSKAPAEAPLAVMTIS